MWLGVTTEMKLTKEQLSILIERAETYLDPEQWDIIYVFGDKKTIVQYSPKDEEQYPQTLFTVHGESWDQIGTEVRLTGTLAMMTEERLKQKPTTLQNREDDGIDRVERIVAEE